MPLRPRRVSPRAREKAFRARSFHLEEKFREDAFNCALIPALYKDLFVGTRRDSNRILNFLPSRLDPFLSTAKSRIVGGGRLVDFNVFDFAPNKDSLVASRFSEIRLRNDRPLMRFTRTNTLYTCRFIRLGTFHRAIPSTYSPRRRCTVNFSENRVPPQCNG